MPFVLQRLTDTHRTEFYSVFAGTDDWTRHADDATEFDTRPKAERRADRVGGEIVEFYRPRRISFREQFYAAR